MYVDGKFHDLAAQPPLTLGSRSRYSCLESCEVSKASLNATEMGKKLAGAGKRKRSPRNCSQ